jgi:hypothetical protein
MPGTSAGSLLWLGYEVSSQKIHIVEGMAPDTIFKVGLLGSGWT